MPVPSDDEVRTWTPEERRQVSRALHRASAPGDVRRMAARGRRTIALVAVAAVVLAVWIVYLAGSLPEAESGGAWRAAWVGFDLLLVAVLATTAWLGSRRRQMTILGLIVAATMVLTDAWFDVMLSLHTRGQWSAIASAVIIEIPFATYLAVTAIRILQRTAAMVTVLRGDDPPTPSLWRQTFLVVPPRG